MKHCYRSVNGLTEKEVSSLTILGTGEIKLGSNWTINEDSNNNLDFEENDVGRLTLESGGNVGIGVTNPSYTLDVSGDINYTGTMYENGVTKWVINGSNIYFDTGNVGIGVTNPSAQLELSKSNPGPNLLLTNSTTSDTFSLESQAGLANILTDSELRITTGGSAEDINLLPTGNVGIGITNPDYTLDINGTCSHRNSCVIRSRTTDLAIANNTIVYVSFTSDIDNGNSDITLTNASTITIDTDGFYYLSYETRFSSSNANKELWIDINSGTIKYCNMTLLAIPVYTQSIMVNLDATDTIQFGIYQTTGGSINVIGTNPQFPLNFTVYRVGDKI